MTTLKEKIGSELKVAMHTKDAVRVSVLRLLRSAIKDREIELRRALSDSDILGVIRTQIKRCKESISKFRAAKRDDLAQKEEKELAILETFMPEAMSEDEIRKTVNSVIEELGATTMKDMGRVMKELMSRLAGKADGSMVSDVVKKSLSGSE
nr:GatB/YqeY domain-containing protein [Desulfobacterales bacterium]